ncbi:MAG: carboxyl-terminal protease [Candidatus Angelobacter sp.]|jgi:carboxyl-terminal processing protease|nr:carboxyl-terminal protease [Candidatus Angelobacter sp.]
MSKKIQVLLLTSSMLIIAFVMIGSLGVHASGASSSGDVTLKHIGVYSEVLYRVRAEYVEEPNMSTVTNGALHGLLESLDADSSYLTPSEYKLFKQKKSEGKASIGATVSKRFGYAAVVSVIPGGPADKAGLNSGDIIETVEGLSTHDLSLAAVKNHLVGDPGSRLELTIIRTRKIEPQKITVVRDVVTLPAVTETMAADNTGVVKAQVLTKGKAAEIADKIKSLQKKGAKKLVLDLRNNSEGEEDEGVAVANLFLGKGNIGSLQGQKVEKVTYAADPQKKITDLPVAVIVNRGTAGAAELVAASILDNSRGDVVGDKTFGEGSVQKLIEVPDGSALILSIAKYYTSKGKVIQDTGITPNIPVAANDEIVAVSDDDDSNTTEEPQKAQPKEDEQLRRAIEVLKTKAQKS